MNKIFFMTLLYKTVLASGPFEIRTKKSGFQMVKKQDGRHFVPTI
jgi:hypothetical protein